MKNEYGACERLEQMRLTMTDDRAAEMKDAADYRAFTEKFQTKLTTDDCYTPELVYEAVADFVAARYQIDRARFVRPFMPNGDFQTFPYAPDAVVVDNPPFSILAGIVEWYLWQKIPFFLFAPALTLFSGSSSCAALPCGVNITYANGASVPTSFLTSLEPDDVRVRILPELYSAVDAANRANQAAAKKTMPKYSYPPHLLTAARANWLCQHGATLTIRKADSVKVSALDAQRARGKAVFGGGYLLSERAAAERAAAVVWELSAREREIIRWMEDAAT